ncbi:MAG: CRISPR-associated protein [Candidatus Delongbacteria bacterium]|nr:CRISPR-associated protein [Candidatus Delongbacteria bacterium]
METKNEKKDNTVINNSDFIFLYEATMCNPNGDPDMENKPRMDYDTKTNLVSKYRKKRDIRNYAKENKKLIFVDTEDERKVSVEQRLETVFKAFLADENSQEELQKVDIWKNCFDKLDNAEQGKSTVEIYEKLKKISVMKKTEVAKDEKLKFINDNFSKLNNELLTHIVKTKLYDIRLFGSAFAVGGFSRTFTGPVQLSWGYSLHPVELMKSNALVTIMNDDNSTFGRDNNLYYSLIAYSGTISKTLADKTNLSEKDITFFREAIIKSTNATPTASKTNLRPVAYLEVKYKKEFDGFMCDLRNFLKLDKEKSVDPIRNRSHVKINIEQLVDFLKIDQVKDKIEKIIVWESLTLKDDDKLFTDLSIKDNNEIELVDRETLKVIV